MLQKLQFFLFFSFFFMKSIFSFQAFTNCMHSYNHARNVHANDATHAWKFVHDIVPLYKNNLKLSICSSFFMSCTLLPPSLAHQVVMLAPLLCCTKFFVCCFYGSPFYSLAINPTSLSQSKGWFLFILLCRREKYHRIGLLCLHINCTYKSWEQLKYSLKHYLNLINLDLICTYITIT